MNAEIIAFLLPQVDPIQLIFFILMLGSVLGIIIWVKKSATPENWENSWCNGTKEDLTDDLDAEHGSVNDISHAVATTAEKLADILPGILLVLGLLGTFLGLGLALNKASSILMDASSSTAGMDSAMSNLMGMMQGLGTKFKTSTWGIIAFLGLKAWSSVNSFEEKRLRWCIRKIKGELDKKRKEEVLRDEEINSRLMRSIQKLGSDLCTTLQSEVSLNRNILEKTHEISSEQKEIVGQAKTGIQILAKLTDLQNRKVEDVIQNGLEVRNVLLSSLEKSNNNSEATQNILRESQSTTAQIFSGVKALYNTALAGNKNLDEVIKESREINLNLIKGIDSLISSSTEQNKELLSQLSDISSQQLQKQQEVIDEVKQTKVDVSNKVASNTQELITKIEANTSVTEKVREHVGTTRVALETFVNANVDNIQAMKASVSGMAVSAGKVGESASALQKATSSFEAKVSNVLDTLKRDLETTIRDMNQSFNNNLTQVSKDLSGATFGISNAVDKLSINVEHTMNDVKSSIGKSLDVQKQAFAVFDTTAETLNEKVQSMTGLVDKVCNNIESGLKAVSMSGRRMESLATLMEEIAGLMRELPKTHSQVTETLELITKNITTEQSKSFVAAQQIMIEMKASLEKSLAIQKEAFAVFDTTTETLNEKIQSMTGLTDKVCANIDSGLKAISISARKNESLGNSIEEMLHLMRTQQVSNRELTNLLDNQTHGV